MLGNSFFNKLWNIITGCIISLILCSIVALTLLAKVYNEILIKDCYKTESVHQGNYITAIKKIAILTIVFVTRITTAI